MTRLFFVFAALAALGLSACGPGPAADTTAIDRDAVVTEAMVQESKVLAVLIHADWCPSCKLMDPEIEAAKAGLDEDGVVFTMLDYTQKDWDGFLAQAEAMGLGRTIADYFPDAKAKTGQLLLIRSEDGQILDIITKTSDANDMNLRLIKALAQT